MEEMKKEIEAIVKSIFPHSFINVQQRELCGKYLVVNFALGSADTWTNAIFENDMVSKKFIIREVGNGYEAEFDGIQFCIKDNTGLYAYGRHKKQFRKAKGDYGKVLVAVERFFMVLKHELNEQAENFVDEKYLKFI